MVEMQSNRPPLYEWRDAMLSPRGPKCSTTRLVLLVLMTWAGSDMLAWPTQEAIARRSALSIRAVREHLAKAEAEGWILHGVRHSRRSGWLAHTYKMRIPELHDQLTEAA